MTPAPADNANITLQGATLYCVGAWTTLRLQGIEKTLAALRRPQTDTVLFNLRQVTAMDTAGAWLLHRSMRQLTARGATVALEEMSDNAQAMLDLVSRYASAAEIHMPSPADPGVLHVVGRATVAHVEQTLSFLAFVGELAPLITAIIVAGRTGSAYTAQIGTMKVTEEIDALRTIGITPMELLVLPKVLALMVALPLLTVYADILGTLGGMIMAKVALDMSLTSFVDRLGEAVDLGSYLIGIGTAPVFAAIIACVGCYQGYRVGGSAESVGRQTTLSVVQAIFLVLVVDAGFSVIFSLLGI